MLTLKNVLSGLFARSTFSVRSAMPARSRRLRLELLEERTLLAAVFTVNSIADPGDGLCTPSECTLREAISAANANVGPDLIEFDIPGAGPHTIQPTSALPEITDPVVIDGYTQYGATANTLSLGDDAVLQIVLDGQSAGDTDGLVIRTGGGGSTVRGLVINQFARSGIRVQSSSANAIEGNFIGTNVSGTVALGNGLDGVLIIEGASSNRVGTNSDGFNDLAERNVISSNGRDGIAISFFSEQNAVGANLIGLDVTGANTLRDARNGIFVFHSSNTTIGGAVSAARNVIADSAAGVHAGINIFDDPPSGSGNNFVLGNYIGTNAAGTAELPAGSLSIRVTGSNNVIGGTVGTTSGGPCTGACNLISGRNGIYIQGYGGNRVEGNHIGTNATGDAGLGNTEGRGVLVQISSGNTIGGTALGAGNVISGWGLDGVMISEPGHDNVVQGNFIGTDATGTVAIGNRHSGVILHDRTSNNTIGGATPGARNIISGNGIGVTIQVHSHNNTVAGNFIGTDVTGASPLANVPGVTITEGSSHNLTGGVADGASNTIAFNHQFGVSVNGLVAPSAGNAILRNSLFANGGLGIDLSMGGGGDGDGPTSNDMGDGDAGANNLQNFPVLNSVASSGGSTMIRGALNSTPNSTFRLEFFSNTVADPSGFGEGEQYLGFTEVATNSIGDAAFTATMPVHLPIGRAISSTATLLVDDDSNPATSLLPRDTSEFSAVIYVPANSPIANAGGPYTVAEGGSVQLDGSGSSDPDQPSTTLIYEWDLNYNGVTFDADVTGRTPSVGFPDDFPPRVIALRVTDSGGLTNLATTTLEVTNVNPVPAFTVAASIGVTGQTLSYAGSFTDPGADTWIMTVDCGSGGTAGSEAIDQTLKTFSFTCMYPTTGTRTAAVTVTDDEGGSGTTLANDPRRFAAAAYSARGVAACAVRVR